MSPEQNSESVYISWHWRGLDKEPGIDLVSIVEEPVGASPNTLPGVRMSHYPTSVTTGAGGGPGNNVDEDG